MSLNEHRSYSAWLSEYTEKLNQLDAVEKAAVDRLDYHEESQAYVDYLDYIDEWQWQLDTKIMEVKQRYLFLQSRRHGKMACDCGSTHILTHTKDVTKGDVVVDEIGVILQQQCWYKTIAEKIKRVMLSLQRSNFRLADPVEMLFRKIVQMKMAESGETPFLLPFDAFQKVWWDNANKVEFSRELLNVVMERERRKIHELRAAMVPKVERKEILLYHPESDHGMHVLQEVLSEADFAYVLGFMNKWRNSLQLGVGRITIDKLQLKREECKYCKEHADGAAYGGLSMHGIYYAPPGGGKTTSQNRELLVGFDTDWIGVGLTWKDYGGILKRKIPIITNQPEMFIGCGLKIIGIVRNDIRIGGDGQPLDNAERLMAWANAQTRNVLFIKVPDEEYLADHALQLQALQMIQQMIGNQTINMLPFYANVSDEEWTRIFPKLIRRKEQELQHARQTVI